MIVPPAANVTIRNIPDDVFQKIKRLSSVERRSINNELLVIIERGTSAEMEDRLKARKHTPRSIQIKLWRNLSREWEDVRPTEEIIQDIYASRTPGREYPL